VFEPGDVVHHAVQMLCLPWVRASYGHPAVGGQASRFVRVTGCPERAAGAHERAGQRVDDIRLRRQR